MFLKLSYEEICELCRWYSRGTAEYGKNSHNVLSWVSKLGGTKMTKEKIGNLLKKFKTDILSTLSSQLDTLQVKIKKEEFELAVAVFYSKCKTNIHL